MLIGEPGWKGADGRRAHPTTYNSTILTGGKEDTKTLRKHRYDCSDLLLLSISHALPGTSAWVWSTGCVPPAPGASPARRRRWGRPCGASGTSAARASTCGEGGGVMTGGEEGDGRQHIRKACRCWLSQEDRRVTRVRYWMVPNPQTPSTIGGLATAPSPTVHTACGGEGEGTSPGK